jgi:RHS repeat-associated protein
MTNTQNSNNSGNAQSVVNAPPPVVQPPALPPLPAQAPSSANPVKAQTPGWWTQPGNPGTMADVSKVVDSRVIDASKIYLGGLSPEFAAQQKGVHANFVGSSVESPASIVELARALKNDPQLIFEHVYNNIEWEPGWGVQKGAGALLDGMGNSFDQSMLLVALLRQAGFTANYVLGQISMPVAQYDSWFGTDSSSNSYCCYYYAQYANIPGTVPTLSGSVWSMVMSHVWVQVVISGTTYVLDPSRKTYTRKAPVANLATILGYNATTFLSDAESGATVDPSGNFVQNMNHGKVTADLTTMTTNLINYIKNNAVGSAPAGTATVDDVLGGQSIVPLTLPFSWQTALSYEKPGDTPTIWTGDVPLTYKTTIQVQYLWTGSGYDIDQTFTSDQLAGTRLVMGFTPTTLRAQLTLNGAIKQTGVTDQFAGTYSSILLTVNHNAYASPVYPQQWWQQYIYPEVDHWYLIANAWGNMGRGQFDYHKQQLAPVLGATNTEVKCGEWSSVVWYEWMAQVSRVADLVGRLNKTHMNFFHQVGIVSNQNGYNVGTDLGGISGFSSTLNYDFTQLSRTNTVVAMHGVTLESITCAQYNGLIPGISTATVIDKANRTVNLTFSGTVHVGDILNFTVTDPAISGGAYTFTITAASGDTLSSLASRMLIAIGGFSGSVPFTMDVVQNGATLYVSSSSKNQTTYTTSKSAGATETMTLVFQKVYKGTSSSWNTGANIQSILVANGYNATEMSNLYSSYLASGNYSVLLGESPNVKLGSWTGEGEWIFPTYSNNGGATGLINNVTKGGDGQDGDGKDKDKNKDDPNKQNEDQDEDPVGMFTGNFFYDRTDLVVGSQAEPYRLSFQRHYDSSMQSSNMGLGYGWTHNHFMTSLVNGDGLFSLGQRSGIQGAMSMVDLFVSMDLANDTAQPVAKLVTLDMVNKWWYDNMVSNLVIITMGPDSFTFVKQPDGSFTAPDDLPGTMTYSSLFKTPQGVVYTFNSSGQIVSVAYPQGVIITYTYTSGVLTSISNGLGRTLTLNYTSGQLTSVTDGTRTVSYAYDVFNDLVTFTDTLNHPITYQYDVQGRMTKYFLPQNSSTAYITNVYDSLSRVQTQANARGQVFTNYFAGARSEVDDPLGNKTVRYFNARGATTRLIDALGFETDTTYDGLNRPANVKMPEGNQVAFAYDLNNNVLTKTQIAKSGSGLSNIVETWTYDPAWAKVKTYKDGRLNTTTFNYDATQGTLLSIQRPVIGGVTPTVTMTWNTRGQMLTSTDESGVVTQYTYDGTTEKLTKKIVDYNTGSGHLNLTSSYLYDAAGNIAHLTDANNNVTSFYWDTERRLSYRTEASPFNYTTNYGYDLNNNLTSVSRATGGTPAAQTYSWTYSVSNEVLTAVDPASNTATWTYDGADRMQTWTDAQSRQWQYGYDALNRVNQVTDPSSTVTDFRTFTNNGKLASIKDARLNVTQFSYDGFDRSSKTTYADTTFEQNSSYDANGNVLTRLTRSGSSIVNTYDVLNRLATKTPTGQAVITLTNDLSGRLTKANKAGTVGTDPSIGDTQYYFDTAGRFYKEQTPDGKTVTHVMDGNGNRTRTTWPDGYYVTRVFDQMNRLTDIKLNGATASAVVFSYNQLSQRTGLTFSNGATVAYTPQVNEDVTSITHNFVGSSVAFTYGYNLVHEPTSVAVSDSTYMWHPAAAGTTAYAAADNVNKYATVGGATYTYDGNKNLSGDGTWTYTYDTENHLLTAAKAGTSVSAVYDPVHRQVQKTVGSAKTQYVYSGWQRIADYDAVAGTLQNRYVYGTGLDEALIVVSSSGALTFLHSDKMGSIVATSNSTGAVSNKNSYSPFGEITTLGGTTHGYTGQRYDSELGLNYFKARYYSPKLGRFLQPDPIGYTGEDFNLYTYVSGSPLKFVDVLGLQRCNVNTDIDDPQWRYVETHIDPANDPNNDPNNSRAPWRDTTPYGNPDVNYVPSQQFIDDMVDRFVELSNEETLRQTESGRDVVRDSTFNGWK